MLELGLDGTVALVTGAGRGIGKGIALELARRGARVVACARSQRELEETKAEASDLPGSITISALDVTDGRAVTDLVRRTESELGPIRLLVNNAGICAALGRFGEVAFSEWWRDVEVNLGGAVTCAYAVVPGMRDAGGGRIVNVISAAAFARLPLWTAYSTSKAALHAFTECLAADLGDEAIRVFSLDPGFVNTTLVKRAVGAGIDSVAEQFRMFMAAGLDVPLERPVALAAALCAGESDEQTGTVFCADEEFSRMVTGPRRPGNQTDGVEDA